MHDIFIVHLKAITKLMKSQLESARNKGIQVQVRNDVGRNHIEEVPNVNAHLILRVSARDQQDKSATSTASLLTAIFWCRKQARTWGLLKYCLIAG
jgi:hypothetical protein